MAEDLKVVDINEAARLAAEAGEKADNEDEKEVKPEDKKEKEPDYLSTDDGKNAKALWDALSDPERAKDVIKALAEKNGYTKAEVKEIKDAVKSGDIDDLKEALGDEYSDFTEKFTPALQKIIDKKVAEATKDVRASLQAEAEEKLNVKITGIIHDLTEKTFGVKELTAEQEAELGKLIKKYPPAKDVKPAEYLSDFFKLLPGQKTSVQKKRSDVGSRLSSAAGGDVEGNNYKPTSGVKMSLQEAAQKAYEENQAKG